MADEMKQKLGVLFHCKSHEVKGFTTDGGGIELYGEIKKLLSDAKKYIDTVKRTDEE